MKYTFAQASSAARAQLAQSAEQRERARERRARYLASLSQEKLAEQRERQRAARRAAAAKRIAREKARVCRVCGERLQQREVGERGRPREMCGRVACKRVIAALSALRSELPDVPWASRGAKIRVANAINDIVRDNLGTGLPGTDYYRERR